MNNKNLVVSVIGAAVILGLAIFLAAMVNSGLILQKENEQPKENILTTTVGHVNLGKVYSESRGMDIILINSEEKSPAAINLADLDPDNFSKELHQALEKIAKDVNKSQGLTGEKALKPETLSGSVQFKLKIKTYMNYRSEYMPMYTLMIKDEDIIIDKGEGLESRITAEAERLLKDSLPAFSSSSFIKSSK
ncbi:hypothetical protein N5C79_19615 [Pantoea brenneri]|uniref:hypothetical protein n=1 Tax=Pantoea brenneri TaxID=472694 RepID=UPI002447E361|nr:hypothetical protein [Pantoea brenneri]MDH1088710.1 hypothetical protein [Pantoea brenneri]